MKIMTLTEARGARVKSDNFTGSVSYFDPVEECFVLDGVSHLKYADGFHWKNDPVRTSYKSLSEFGIEIKYTPEEQKMVDEAKLTKQVAKNAQALLSSITAWLNRPGGR